MLVLCTVCQRHARAVERACPFCGGALGPPMPRRAVKHRARAALLFGAIAAGCGGAQTSAEEPAEPPQQEDPAPAPEPVADPVDDPGDDYAPVAEYGAPGLEE